MMLTSHTLALPAASFADFLSMHSRVNARDPMKVCTYGDFGAANRAKCNCKTSHRRTLFYNSSPTLCYPIPRQSTYHRLRQWIPIVS